MSQARKRKSESKAITYRGFLNLPAAMVNHPDFYGLSGSAVRLLVALGGQYNGYNNGDLCASMSLMGKRGWNSNSQLSSAIAELVEKNWVIKSRQGGFREGPNLYAITWQPIDNCNGKLDIRPTNRAHRTLR